MESQSKNRPIITENRLSLRFSPKTLTLSIGVSVNATKDEIITAPDSTIPNSRKSRPVIPCRNTMGINTDTSVTVVDMMAKKISLVPSCPAFMGFIPFSIFEKIFSTTTMASSTTRPVASTIPSRESTLMEKSIRYITKNEPTREMGIVIMGIRVVLQRRRKTKITITTSINAIRIVSRTSLTALRIEVVISMATSRRISSGSSRLSISTRLYTSSAMVI